MRYTDKQYYIEKEMVKKLDLFIKRNQYKRDNLLLVDGSTGDGKSTATIGWAYYIAHKMGKPFSTKNVFFDVEKMMKFIAETESQVIMWDEAATSGMAVNWQSKVQQKLVKVLMMARKKKHFYFFVIPRFWKLNEYLISEAIGLAHLYSPDMIKQGYFVYFRKENKDYLYDQFKKKSYKSYKIKYDFRGTFVKKGFVIDEKEYDIKKDEAIRKILNEKPEHKTNVKTQERNWLLKAFIKEKAKREGRTEKSVCEEVGLSYDIYRHIQPVRNVSVM